LKWVLAQRAEDAEKRNQKDLAEEVDLARASQHLIDDHGDHKQNVDAERPKKQLLEATQMPPGNLFLLESGQLIRLKGGQN
jgi:hypothetical protein